MTGPAIVAIPAEDDYVWRISSEKIPHMTILHFDEDVLSGPELAQVDSFLAHIVETELPHFGMSVDYRGTLGPDDADVLFFQTHFASDILRARNDMLSNPVIRKGYNASQQHPGWTPHLTLGYPATPAKKDDREYPGFTWVRFDKLAFWMGNFDGPEYRLGDREDEVGLSMSGEFAGVTLAHASFSTKPWSDFKESDYSLEQWIRACLIGPSEKSESKSDYSLPVREPSGTLNKNGMTAAAGVLAGARGGVKASSDQQSKAKKKLLGLYKSIGEDPPDSLTHSDAPLDILAHYGVKGMKWGVRKDSSISSTSQRSSHLRRKATDVTAKQKPGQFVRTSGGKRQTASEDAVKVAATRQLAKKSTTDTLTNKQLQDAVTRMNLEQQYHTLVKKTNRQTRGQRFVSSLLGGNKPLDKNGNPLPNNGPSAPSAAASMVGTILKSKASR
jgi:hypothetical protein